MKLPLHVATIVLDGQPWIQRVFESLVRTRDIDWTWRIAEGVSANVKDTSWMRAQLPRLSRDGTTAFIDACALADPRVSVVRRKLWMGKTEQINACLSGMPVPCVLLQCDSDEVWTPAQLEKIVRIFEERPSVDWMQFRCRYFLGKNIVASRLGAYGNRGTEWLRAWRVDRPDQRFVTHEPPCFDGNRGVCLPRSMTEELGLVFDHFAYATEAQVEYKEVTYGYPGAVARWRRLQVNQHWPVKLKRFLPWVDDLAEADLVDRVP